MDISLTMRPLYYYNGEAYCQVEREFKEKLITKGGTLKAFVVLDVTKGKTYTDLQFVKKFFKDVKYATSYDVVEKLDTLRFKVFKKVKIKKDNR